MAVETLGQALEMYEQLEERYLRIFGTKRISDGDSLRFETQQQSSLMYFSDIEN